MACRLYVSTNLSYTYEFSLKKHFASVGLSLVVFFSSSFLRLQLHDGYHFDPQITYK